MVVPLHCVKDPHPNGAPDGGGSTGKTSNLVNISFIIFNFANEY